jgi:hypothetical protein
MVLAMRCNTYTRALHTSRVVRVVRPAIFFNVLKDAVPQRLGATAAGSDAANGDLLLSVAVDEHLREQTLAIIGLAGATSA